MGLGFLSSYILIKAAGVSDYGAYVYIFNLVNLLLNFCLLGVDTLAVKNISVYHSTGSHPKLKGVLVFSLMVALAGSLTVAFISAKAGFLFGWEVHQSVNWYILASSSLLLLSLNAVIQGALQGLKKIILSQIAEKLVRPVLLMLMVAALFFFGKITLQGLVYCNVLAIGLTFLLTLFFLYRHIGSGMKRTKPEYELARWINSAAFFFLIGVLYVLNSRIDIFFLGFFKGSRQVGIYNILLRVSDVISFGLTIVNFVLSPLIARFFANGNAVLVQKVITRSAQVTFLCGLVLIVFIVIFRNPILNFFGVNYMNAPEALLILSAGQLVNVFFGSVGTLLMMSGNEKFSIFSLLVSTVFNFVSNVTLIPAYGVVGAATATAGSLAIWNVLMYVFVRRKLHIRTTALGVM